MIVIHVGAIMKYGRLEVPWGVVRVTTQAHWIACTTLPMTKWIFNTLLAVIPALPRFKGHRNFYIVFAYHNCISMDFSLNLWDYFQTFNFQNVLGINNKYSCRYNIEVNVNEVNTNAFTGGRKCELTHLTKPNQVKTQYL